MIIKNKNEIIRKAIPVFNREGIPGASVAAIAKEIGIVKGTLYYYFDS
ncbi:TetR/AcrR family transcriptional regulator [Sediminispirochaeta bajacaliforniensis]